MKRFILVLTGCLFLFAGICNAGNYGFETTLEGITKSLMEPRDNSSSDTGGWKALTDTPKPPAKTRGIKVLKKEKGVEVWETITVPEKRTGGFVNLKIQFDVNSYRLRPGSFAILNELGKALLHPKLKDRIIYINGHTDSDGKETYNMRLSLNRASSVKKYLIDHHAISQDRLKIMGYGENMPLKPNTSARNKQLNRRVEIVAGE